MKKKLGIGSMSLMLFVLGFLWSVDIQGQFCLGDRILNAIDLPAWSNGNSGNHYTIIYALIFLIPSIIVGFKFPDDLFAKTGKVTSMILAGISILCLFFVVIL